MPPVPLKDMMPAKDEGWRTILYGSAGTGKTTLAGGFPKPMLIFDFDGKLDPLYGIDGIDVLSYAFNSPNDCFKLWQQFMRDFKAAKTSHYKTLVFDSLTYMNKLLITSILINSGKAPDSRPQIQNFGEQKDNYEFLFMEMNKIPTKNILLLAHIMDVSDDSTDQPILLERCPLITGRVIKGILPALFKEVYFLERRDGDKRVLYYKPYKKAIANTLLLKGDGKIEDPTYEKIQGLRK